MSRAHLRIKQKSELASQSQPPNKRSLKRFVEKIVFLVEKSSIYCASKASHLWLSATLCSISDSSH